MEDDKFKITQQNYSDKAFDLFTSNFSQRPTTLVFMGLLFYTGGSWEGRCELNKMPLN